MRLLCVLTSPDTNSVRRFHGLSLLMKGLADEFALFTNHAHLSGDSSSLRFTELEQLYGAEIHSADILLFDSPISLYSALTTYRPILTMKRLWVDLCGTALRERFNEFPKISDELRAALTEAERVLVRSDREIETARAYNIEENKLLFIPSSHSFLATARERAKNGTPPSLHPSTITFFGDMEHQETRLRAEETAKRLSAADECRSLTVEHFPPAKTFEEFTSLPSGLGSYHVHLSATVHWDENLVLQSIRLGAATVASLEACHDLDLQFGKEVVFAHHPETIVATIRKLVSDAEFRRNLIQGGEELFRSVRQETVEKDLASALTHN